ncbi:MAG: alpha/beta hydrolase [Anaerovoracaceae bacterium]
MILETSGANLFYEKKGSGMPIILLHGNGGSHKAFRKTTAILKKHFAVYAVDMRCHGKSSRTRELHYSSMADDIKEFICLLKLKKPVVYGFSDGGIVALLLSIKYPNLLSEIIVSGVNTHPTGLKNPWLTLFKALYFITKSPKFKLLIGEPNISDDMLSTIKIPVHITAGSKDIVHQAHLQNIANKIKSSTLTILSGETHSSYVVKKHHIANYILNKIHKSK